MASPREPLAPLKILSQPSPISALRADIPCTPMSHLPKPFTATALALIASLLSFTLQAAEIPKVGDVAPDFTLKTLENTTVHLDDLTTQGNVVLVVLRGWPGYQCPLCDRQVHDFIAAAAGFAAAKTRVVFIYPGPADGLAAHADEFSKWKGKEWPKEYLFALDPDYSMVNAYGLRWDAPKETAYPSTFVLDGKRTVRFATVSKSHGGRTKATDVVAEAGKLTAK